MTSIILRNRAQCKYCNDIIESKSRHDYVECSCGKAMVDGGRDYLRGNIDQIHLSRTIPSFDDVSKETTLTLIEDFEEWNNEFLELEKFAKTEKKKELVKQHRLAMYDRMFNKYGWINRIKELCK